MLRSWSPSHCRAAPGAQARRHRHSDIDAVTSALGKLKVPEIKAVAERLHSSLFGKRKAAMLTTFGAFVTNTKMSADQISLSLTSVG